jgi:hypothetical protein
VAQPGAGPPNGAIRLGRAAGLPGGSSVVSRASTSMLLARSDNCRYRWSQMIGLVQ